MSDQGDLTDRPRPPVSPWLLLIYGVMVDASAGLLLAAGNAEVHDHTVFFVLAAILGVAGSLLTVIGAIGGAILVALTYDRWRHREHT